MNDAAIVCKDVSVRKKKNTLLNNVSFLIEPGTICGLLGPSGAGKTTLMRVIMGIQIAKEGSVTVLGSYAGSLSARRQIGYVTQAPSIYTDLTVKQNLHYFARLIGANKAAVEEAIAAVHLEPQRSQLAATLSGGQLTRVSLAITLLGKPRLLILDEPTVGLDPLLRRDLWNLFKDMAHSGTTLLVSSHAMNEAANCQQLLLLREGKLLWSDTGEKLFHLTKSSSVEAAFISLMETEL